MKGLIFVTTFIFLIAIVAANALNGDVQDNRPFQDAEERDCVGLEKECTNNRNGCCESTGYSDISCQCYNLIKDNKRYNQGKPKGETKCFCQRTGYWFEKLGDYVAEKLG